MKRVCLVAMLPCLFLLPAGFLTGCSDDDDATAPEIEIYRPQNSVENVLFNLEQAYERRDIVAYEKLFADSFYFVFDPADVAEDPDLPPYWGLEDELQSAGNMFAEPLVQKITVDFVVGDPVAATGADQLGDHVFPPGTMKTTVTEVLLRVDTRDPQGGENIVYQVIGDRALFFLYPHPTESVGGLPVWYIIEWRDQKIGALALGRHGETSNSAGLVIETTWGQIKSLFN